MTGLAHLGKANTRGIRFPRPLQSNFRASPRAEAAATFQLRPGLWVGGRRPRGPGALRPAHQGPAPPHRGPAHTGPAPLVLAPGLRRRRRPAGKGRAMSHGAGLVRTTCSSGSAPGAGAGAGPLGVSSLENLLDPIYPRTHGAILKVAQMVREARARAGVLRRDAESRVRGADAAAAGASRPGRGRESPQSS